MQKELRQRFNEGFSEEKYQVYVEQLENLHPGALDFRNAETPVFVPREFTGQMLDACEQIIDVIVQPGFRQLTDTAIPRDMNISNEKPYADFIAFDFGICENENGVLEPQLIEMQGFPTIFAYQAFHTAITEAYAQVPATHSAYLNGYNETSYVQLLKDVIVGELDPPM
jgi:hypothetical protein